ncbi:MAG: toxin [Candidatus Omnitrophota bacterium]|nr:toxin [Candidatus Omnitrophota bacterium]
MKAFDWDEAKNEDLLQERNISFEEIVWCIEQKEGLLDVIDHPNQTKFAHQKLFIVALRGYVYIVPFVEDGHKIFLKTIYPSRKLTRKYLGKEGDHEID